MDNDYVAEDCEFPKRPAMPLYSLEHDWGWENSRRYSEEAFADWLEWRLPNEEPSALDPEIESELRKEFMMG